MPGIGKLRGRSIEVVNTQSTKLPAMARRGSEMAPDQGRYILHDPDYGGEILSRLNAFRSDSIFTDTILCVEHEEFPCHRNVLAVSSAYFQAMFTSDLKESREIRISFSDVSAWTLKRIIDYAYSGQLEITHDNAQEMLAAGNHFEYPRIVEACAEFLRRQLHPSNCLEMENFATLHNCTKLQQGAHTYILENFSNVVEYDEFLELTLERLKQFISSDLIDVRNEEIVYEAVMRWVKFDVDERRSYLPELLNEVRLGVLDMSSLRLIERDPLVTASPECYSLVTEAQQLKTSMEGQMGKRRRSHQDNQVQPRPSTVAKEVVVVIGGIPQDSTYLTQTVEMYDPQKGKWLSLPDFPQLISWFSATVLHNAIYVTGGILNSHIVATTWRFDASRRTWKEVQPMLKPRAHHSSAVMDDRLYVVGGLRFELNKLLNIETIECYNSTTNTWTAAGRTMFPRKQSQLVLYNSTIVEVGGLQGGDCAVDTMTSYHIVGDMIKPTGEQFVLPQIIQYAQIVVINSVFYILWEDRKEFIALDAAKRTFRSLPCPKYIRKHSGTVVVQNKIYLVGGLIDQKPSRLVECFDPETNTWTMSKDLKEGRAMHGCVRLEMS